MRQKIKGGYFNVYLPIFRADGNIKLTDKVLKESAVYIFHDQLYSLFASNPEIFLLFI